jgi:DMSO/TMAO reductase YedYZ molybdopterin-dependent catalytic subunit
MDGKGTMIPLRLPPTGSSPDLPPGQSAISTFPRFGTAIGRAAPPVGPKPSIRIDGQVERALEIPVAKLAGMERRQVTADFHCVAGWSHRGLRWSGVPFGSFYEATIAPRISPDARVSHVLFRGADGYKATLLLEDACADNVLLADRLGGDPLTGDHGAPVRLVSPSQYGYKSVKHLIAIELHASEPRELPARLFPRLTLGAIRAHPRGRVAMEERHRYLPAWAVRWPYRNLFYPVIARLPQVTVLSSGDPEDG